jgi:hypothetical protein
MKKLFTMILCLLAFLLADGQVHVHNEADLKADLYARIPATAELMTLLGENALSDRPITYWQYDASSMATDNFAAGVIKPTSIGGGSPGRWLHRPHGYLVISSDVISVLGFTPLSAEVDGSITNEIELPSQSGQSGKVLSTNGTSPTWVTAGNGTVTSVGLTMPSAFNVANSPITTSGTLAVTATGNNQQVIDGTGALKTITTFSGYSSGTVYNITTTSAKVDFGTNDPVITITTPGTYLLISNIRIDYTGLTNLAANTVTSKLRRTNNTAADLTNATGDFVVPPVTLLTATGGDCDINTVVYTTANSNDVIELWAARSGSISVGNIQAGNAWIMAVRLY